MYYGGIVAVDVEAQQLDLQIAHLQGAVIAVERPVGITSGRIAEGQHAWWTHPLASGTTAQVDQDAAHVSDSRLSETLGMVVTSWRQR